MSSVCPFTFSKKHVPNVSGSNVIKFHAMHHQVEEKLQKVFGLIGLELIYIVAMDDSIHLP